MASTIDMLRTLVHKDDARRWADVNNKEIIEKGDTLFIDEYILTFTEDGRLSGVEQQIRPGRPL